MKLQDFCKTKEITFPEEKSSNYPSIERSSIYNNEKKNKYIKPNRKKKEITESREHRANKRKKKMLERGGGGGNGRGRLEKNADVKVKNFTVPRRYRFRGQPKEVSGVRTCK